MSDLIREAPLGQALRWISRNKLFQYPEERDDFVLPVQYTTQLNSEKDVRHSSAAATPTRTSTQVPSSSEDSDVEGLSMSKTKSRAETMPYSNERFEVEQQLALERTKTIPIVPKKTTDGIILVDWVSFNFSEYSFPVRRSHELSNLGSWALLRHCFYSKFFKIEYTDPEIYCAVHYR